MMKPFGAALIMWVVLVACSDSKETRQQRFLLKGNELLVKQNYPLAHKNYEEALRLDSCYADALNNLGTVYFRQKQYAEALQYYSTAIGCKPGFLNAHFNRANTFYELGKPDDALRDIQYIKREKPDTLTVYFLEGLVYTKKRDYAAALASFDRALAMDSLNAELWVNIGTVHYYAHNFEASRAALVKAYALDDTEANAYNTLALLSAAEEKFDEAMNWITKALDLKPRDAFFLNNRGFIYLLQDNREAALEDINKSITLDPYNGWAYRNKGIYYLKSDDATAALRVLKQAVDLDPFIDEVFYYLAEAYLKTGDRTNACVAWSESKARGENVKVDLNPCINK
ncbi:MAG: tetratricopeptide repeat protein [Cyclobacteriaceae bacterium]|nr:tetratricopeptide repeat protein [Cyclobacteriaceae bacterium]UYN88291.1 MAG: tetratricopeptide repeat protein [Cyclobacteriaceae bacterium]